MNYRKLINVVLVVSVLTLSLVGCGSAETVENNVVEDDGATEAVQGMPVPYSKGPSSLPSVKGPTSPVPEAVTEVEEVEYRLPEKE